MKRLMLMSMLALCIVMVGCTTSGGAQAPSQPVLTPVQIANIACPQLNLLHDQFNAMNAVLIADPKTADIGSAGAKALAAVDPVAHAVCNGVLANPNVNLANLQQLVSVGLPALGNLAQTLPMTPQQKAQVQAGLAISETLVAMVNALKPVGDATAPSPSQPSAPAASSSVGK